MSEVRQGMEMSKIENLAADDQNALSVSATDQDTSLLGMATNIVSSYVQGNEIDRADVLSMIDEVYAKLTQLNDEPHGMGANRAPAVPIEDSVTPDYIICLEDGKSFKMLKKHLMAVYSMTPEDYRAKWRLPVDYPMVAPNYAAKRQELARKSGLGRKRS